MTRETIKAMLQTDIDELFYEYQESIGVQTGDISPLQALRLENIEDEIVDLIIQIGEQNKGE